MSKKSKEKAKRTHMPAEVARQELEAALQVVSDYISREQIETELAKL